MTKVRNAQTGTAKEKVTTTESAGASTSPAASKATAPVRIGWRRGEDAQALVDREWIVTNGLGGYASGTIAGVATRRFHGLLIAALPTPYGRTMFLNHLAEELVLPGGRVLRLSGEERPGGHCDLPDANLLSEFRLEAGLPHWRFEAPGLVIEKRLLLTHLQNTVYVTFRVLAAEQPVLLRLRPRFNARPHEGRLDVAPQRFYEGEQPTPHAFPYELAKTERGLELHTGEGRPPLRLRLQGEADSRFVLEDEATHFLYRIERSRGYDSDGLVFSPGYWELALSSGADATLVASVESWDKVDALTPLDAYRADSLRRRRLIDQAHPALRQGIGAELVLAAEQFVMTPHSRVADEARLHAEGDQARSVIAGYHWFTDWGRDTMISLEGLTLLTGRAREGRHILQTFSHYIRDGLLPNMFPEGENQGLYHTADATLWFFHALSRYERLCGDVTTRRYLMPKLIGIIDHHLAGTRFGIRVDPDDGLLRQGADGYQLTWMDAKVDGWVVTPRRGKAVEINALFYNALRLMEAWSREDDDDTAARRFRGLADRVHESFNQRFWYDERGYLYDVVDAEGGTNDASLRPNQVFAISLPHPVLDRARWRPVMDTVRKSLLTPLGLRSLAPGHSDYKPTYDGDLRARDAAYHQGTVWGWLIGPFVDAWLKVYPEDRPGVRQMLDGLLPHLADTCVGSLSEIFDAEPPFTPRGCVAQAWSVAEAIRGLVAISEPP